MNHLTISFFSEIWKNVYFWAIIRTNGRKLLQQLNNAFLNAINLLTNTVNRTGTTFILTLFCRVLRDLWALLAGCESRQCEQSNRAAWPLGPLGWFRYKKNTPLLITFDSCVALVSMHPISPCTPKALSLSDEQQIPGVQIRILFIYMRHAHCKRLDARRSWNTTHWFRDFANILLYANRSRRDMRGANRDAFGVQRTLLLP